ncbi:MAG: GyrI-like domain-containing protein [Bacteroidales bacterium]|nr:GyrI-like domain-containing protein [Bacteroidales bacterium]
MRAFGKIVMWLLIILAVLVVIAYLLPRQYKVERSIVIGASSELVYDLTCNLNNWDLWSVWTKEVDTTALFELSGNDCEAGTIWKWNGKLLGNGELIVTEVVPEKSFSYELLFDEGNFRSTGGFRYEEMADSVLVIWSDEGDLGFNPVYRYMGLFMSNTIGPDFELGLERLKEIAEERHGWPPIEEKMMEDMLVLLIRDSAGPDNYSQIMGKGYSEIYRFIKLNRLAPKGHPFAIYHSWDSVTQFSVFDIGIAVENAKGGKGRIRLEEIPAQKVLMADYHGPYEKTEFVYRALDKYVAQEGLVITGGPWEVYVTDPMLEPDTAKWNTQILFPIK